MTEYTPSLSEMQGAYEFDRMCTTDTNRKGARAEFDRALAKIQADAWDEGMLAGLDMACVYACGDCQFCNKNSKNPYVEETK